MNEQDILRQCIARGFTMIPHTTYPSVYDRHDQQSDFMRGLILGLKKMDRGLSESRLIEFLIRNSLLHVRAMAFKALRKSVIVRCVCGKELSKRFDSFKKIKPCHGTVDEVTINRLVSYNSDLSLLELKRLSARAGMKEQRR